MKDYAEFYQKLTKPFQSDQRKKILNLVSQCLTAVFYIAYPVLLLQVGMTRTQLLWKFILIPAVSFVLVSWYRAKVNRPRPYEQEDITPLIAKETSGHSFPSRHAFCAVIIAMTYLDLYPVAGVILLILAVCNSTLRVIGGVHYPRDVFAGFAAGIAFGLLYFL